MSTFTHFSKNLYFQITHIRKQLTYLLKFPNLLTKYTSTINQINNQLFESKKKVSKYHLNNKREKSEQVYIFDFLDDCLDDFDTYSDENLKNALFHLNNSLKYFRMNLADFF